MTNEKYEAESAHSEQGTNLEGRDDDGKVGAHAP